jgi:hypothetical protein
MAGLYETLEKIKDKPGMYLGHPSITALQFFIEGYEFARGELGIESPEAELEFHRDFQAWIQQKLEVQTISSWAKIIQLYCTDEKEAFFYFFRLLDEFLAQKNLSSVKGSSQSEFLQPANY